MKKDYLSDLKSVSAGRVTFGDRATRRIVGKGQLNHLGFSPPKDVMLVEGLTANLISISHLCDQGLNVSFTKDQCVVTDDANAHVMIGTHFSDNYYLWSTNNVSNM